MSRPAWRFPQGQNLALVPLDDLRNAKLELGNWIWRAEEARRDRLIERHLNRASYMHEAGGSEVLVPREIIKPFLNEPHPLRRELAQSTRAESRPHLSIDDTLNAQAGRRGESFALVAFQQ
jgi:hypothetical protein